MSGLRPGDHAVAIGSSFAAGPGLRPRAAGAPRASGRSSVNYPQLVAERLGLRLTDVTYSGATTSDLLEPSARAVPAQVDALRPDTRLVTITAGGNDVGYVPVLMLASLPWPIRRLPAVRERLEELTDPEATASRFADLSARLADVLETVVARAPRARVVLVGYLSILPRGRTVIGRVPDARSAAWAEGTGRRLSDTFADAAGASGPSVEFLDAGTASADHHAWSADPWVRRFHPSIRGGAPYHPNAVGMRAVANLLTASLRGS